MIVITVIFVQSPAEELKPISLSANIGKGAFTSGFDVTLMLENSTQQVEITANHERFYAVHFWKLAKWIKAGVCAGAFKNQPQVGPYVVISPVKFLSVFYWQGWGAGKPEHPKFEVNYFFNSAGASIRLGNLKISYIWIDFMRQQEQLPGISYSFKLSSKIKGLIGVDYKIQEDLPLFRIGATYSL